MTPTVCILTESQREAFAKAVKTQREMFLAQFEAVHTSLVSGSYEKSGVISLRLDVKFDGYDDENIPDPHISGIVLDFEPAQWAAFKAFGDALWPDS